MADYATPGDVFSEIFHTQNPQATALVIGASTVPKLSGTVKFYTAPYDGVLIEAEIFGLPYADIPGGSQFYGFHIHQFGDCANDFRSTGNHFNPGNTIHPYHAGDFPPLLGNQGYAWTAFYTKRFTLDEIIDKAVIIHNHYDDFSSQPSGNAGSRIGCGVIVREIELDA